MNEPVEDNVKQIPSGVYKYNMKPRFVSYPPALNGIEEFFNKQKSWCVMGPADLLQVGKPSVVYGKEDKREFIEPLKVVAKRNVLKQNGDRVDFVIVTFDRVADNSEGETES